MTLRARLGSAIEDNVSLERLVDAKRAMRVLLGELAPAVERTLRLPAGSVARLLVSLGALLLGAEESRTGPAWDRLDLPPDVAEFMRLHAEMVSSARTLPGSLPASEGTPPRRDSLGGASLREKLRGRLFPCVLV